MHIVVTGSTGLIGSHLVAALAEEGHRLTTLARHPALAPGAAHHALDVTTAAARAVAAQGETIVHLAGLADASSSLGDPLGYNLVNATGALNMLEAARQGGAHFILASTQRIYRISAAPLREDAVLAPADPYAYSKLVAEKWVEMYNGLYGLGATVLRFFSVYGPGQVVRQGSSGVLSIFVQRALRGEDLSVEGRQVRDFTHVADVVQGIRLAVAVPAARGRVYNIATGRGTELDALASLVKLATQSTAAVRQPRQEGPPRGYVADISRAEKELGFRPQVDLRAGLESYVRWLCQEGQAVAQGPARAETVSR